MTPPALALAAALAAHSASLGASRFDVDVDDAAGAHIAVAIDLIEPDLKELCNVEFGVVDPQKRRFLEEQVTTCIAEGLPQWLRVRSDGKACTVGAGRFARARRAAARAAAGAANGAAAGAADGARDGANELGVELRAEVSCPPLAGRVLTIDWGLFQSTAFDHQSRATVTFRPRKGLLHELHTQAPVNALLSRRKNKLVIPVEGGVDGAVVAGAAVGVVAVVGVVVGGVVAVVRRRRRSQQAR